MENSIDFKTPILFLIYNRPEYTQKVFDSIKKVKPEKLFVSADGPKENNEGDEKLCQNTRDILKQIDWECELHTNFKEQNHGCRLGVSQGINWFFEHVEEGIILEDDCLPCESFYFYCEKLLKKYKNEEKIMMISGSNPVTEIKLDSDYFFSRFFHIWGWATWKRAWQKFDLEMKDWHEHKNRKILDKIFSHNIDNKIFIEQMFDDAYGNDKSSVWSLQWTYSCLINDGLVILPSHNLVSNIGLKGVHEMNEDQLFLKTKEININDLKHPNSIKIDSNIENLIFEKSGLKKLIK
jgi:hypothetical protein